mmetsp:Transcript_21039/g.51860  ORF Transcript_21039/g.51860 Transcript_21039/m.51860 type:complete len:181 (-) Transcript_21039:110-652(-)
MGILLSSLWRQMTGAPQYKICMIGLDNAGKTTILYKLHLGEVVSTTPTIGSNVETITHRNITFQVWDLGGQASLRDSWSLYYVDSACIIMVVDSADPERVQLAAAELKKALAVPEISDVAVLVMANKQDVRGALSTAELIDSLGLSDIQGHNWHIQGCCATSGAGLNEAIDWVTNNLPRG